MKFSTFFTSILFLIIPFSSTLIAQNAEQDLENGVKIYNALQEYTKTLRKPEDITSEVLNSVKKRVKEGVALMDKVINDGSAEQIKTARYFKVNFRYTQAFVLGIKSDNTTSFKELSALKDEYESYANASMFPLKYKFEGKNFVIQYDDFTPSLSEYYTATAELAGNLNKKEMQYDYAKKAFNFPKSSNYFKYLSCTYIIDYLNDKKTYNAELAQYSLDLARIYNNLSKEERTGFDGLFYPNPLNSGKNILKVLNANPNFENYANISGEAASMIMSMDKGDDAVCIQLLEAAVRGEKYQLEALSYSQSRLKGENIILGKNMTLADFEERNKRLGIDILDKNAAKISEGNCDELKKMADNYALFNETQKSQSFNTRATKCLDNRKKEEERRKEEQRKEEERRERERRRANREFHVYAGVNVFPLLSKPIDLGGVLNIGAKNMIVEFSYLKVTQKKENYFDLSLRGIDNITATHTWDGYFTHIALKFANRKTSSRKAKTYVGPLFAYNQRTFTPFTAQVTNTTTSQSVRVDPTFTPTNKQYIAMLNMGMMVFSGIGGDLYLGIGAAYNQFDGGNSTYWNKENYKINDGMVANRKPDYFSFTMRIGVSIGIGW